MEERWVGAKGLGAGGKAERLMYVDFALVRRTRTCRYCCLRHQAEAAEAKCS